MSRAGPQVSRAAAEPGYMVPPSDPLPVLVVRARGQACALAVADVWETMRPLAVRPVADLPPFVSGMAVVRGTPMPVLDLGLVLGAVAEARPSRFVTVRAGDRPVALAVDEVVGLRSLDAAKLEALPAAHAARGARAALIAGVGTIDKEFLVVLRAGNLLGVELWRGALAAGG